MITNARHLIQRMKRLAFVALAAEVLRRYKKDGGEWLAAVMSYYGFLSLFPLILLGVAFVGLFVANDPAVRLEWTVRLVNYFPGLSDQITAGLDQIGRRSAGFGLVGLAGLIWTGMKAMESSSYALGIVYRRQLGETTLRQKARALLATGTIGVAALAGIILSSAVGGWQVSPPLGYVTKGLGVVLSIAADFAVFLLAYRLLTPKPGPKFARLWQGTLLAAGGWTALKVGGSWYVSQQARSAGGTYGTLAAVIAVLALLYLAARLFLYGAELNAVLTEHTTKRTEHADDEPVPARAQPAPLHMPEVAKKS